MKNIIYLAAALVLGACAFPRTPDDGDLIRATRQFQPELFASGARGEIIVKMHDDQTDDAGWFGKKYTNVLYYRNTSSGEAGYLEMKPKSSSSDYAAAMLPIGDYEVSNLKLSYVWTESRRQGNMTITTTHLEEHDGFLGGDRLSFNVRAGMVLYIGDIALRMGDNTVSKNDRSINARGYEISDKSAEIPAGRKAEWESEFGKPMDIGMIQIQRGARPVGAADKIGTIPAGKGKKK
jgi:hypothetical protein